MINEPIMFRPPVLTTKLKHNAPPRLVPALPRSRGWIVSDISMPAIDPAAYDIPTYQRKPVSHEKLERLQKAPTLPSLLRRQAQ